MCALSDISIRIESALSAPPCIRAERLEEVANVTSVKELAGVFPTIIRSIFGLDGRAAWGLRSPPTLDRTDSKISFDLLAPTGTLFKICYRLLGDPQLRYPFPLRLLPIDVVHALESGRFPQYYMDLINVDPQTRQIVSLNLNPFDYYIFHFAIHLHCTSYNRESRDAWNTVYYELSCEYLLHFLPADINAIILPQIIEFSGKTPAVSHMQVSNRHVQFPSLLISQDAVACANPSGANGGQLHPRGEIWRSETILQVFVDVWLNAASQYEFPPVDGTVCHSRSTYPASEHVRIARALIKQCHAFSLGGTGDPTGLGELRRATPGILAPRAHAHIERLMRTWPLDSSFRLVLELWFSFIQPWRYANVKEKKDRFFFGSDNNSIEEQKPAEIDASFVSFISKNLLTYTEIFQLVVPRFLRLNLTVPKNAVMLFRLTKVFSQTNLVRLLTEIENSVANDLEPMMNASENPSTEKFTHSFNNSSPSRSDRLSNTDNGAHHNISAISNSAWESIDGIDAGSSNQYRPLLLGSGRQMVRELLVYATRAYKEAIETIKFREEQINSQRKGIFSSIYYWFVGENSADDVPLDEMKKVPVYLSTSISQLVNIFSLDSDSTVNTDYLLKDNTSRNLTNTSLSDRQSRKNFAYNVLLSPRQAKDRINHIRYMGDPDLQPVKSNENAFLVRVFNQVASKINEMYQREMEHMWNRNDLVGILSKEVLSPPCVIHTYSKSSTHNTELIQQNLPPRISLRFFASNSFIYWFNGCFVISYLLGYGVLSFIVFCISVWFLTLIFNAIMKCILPSRNNNVNEN